MESNSEAMKHHIGFCLKISIFLCIYAATNEKSMTKLQLDDSYLYKILYNLCILPEFSALENNKNKICQFGIYMLRNNNRKILNLLSIMKQSCFYRSIKLSMYSKNNCSS